MITRGFFGRIKKEYNRTESVCVALSVVLLLAVGAYAWFSSNGLRYFFGVKPITQAYTLYLTDSKDQRPLELRTKIPPSINSKQEVVFKVKSRRNESDVSNENIKYELELDYTENMPVIYKLYKYQSSSDSYVYLDRYTTDITAERRRQAYTDSGYDLDKVHQMNRGMYRQYIDKDTGLSYFEMGEAPDVYKIEVSWDDSRVKDPGDLTEYNKETDLIYIVVREVSTEKE